MSNNIDAVFNKVDDTIFEVIFNSLFSSTKEFSGEAKRVARELEENFFKLLATKGRYLDVEAGAFGAKYPRLSDDWSIVKVDNYIISNYLEENRFYYGIGKGGHLIDQLRTKRTSDYFGKSTVTVGSNKAAEGINIQGARPRIQKGLPGAGQFASFKNIRATITLDLFSRIQNNASQSSVLDLLGSKAWAKKLAVNDQGSRTANIPSRPLFTNFFNWYISTHMPNELKRRLKI